MEFDLNIAIAAVGAGIAVGAAGLGSGIGAGISGATGAGVIAENPKKFGSAIVFQAIPQTQGFYGFLIGVLILFGTGILTGSFVSISIGTALACLGAGIAIGIAGFSAIGQGIAAGAGLGAAAENDKMFARGIVFSVLPETQAIYGLLVAILLLYFTGVIGGGNTTALLLPAGLAALGAGIAIGVSGMTAIGQGIAAAGGVGATSENEGMFAKGLMFSVLPETQSIYALLIAILLMYFTGIIGGMATDHLSVGMGFAGLAAGLAVGLAGLSGIGQGIVSSAGVAATAKRSDAMGKSLILAVMPETFAILGLLTAILIMVKTGLLGGI